MKLFKCLLLFFFNLSFLPPALCQKYDFRNYSVEHGLAQSQVRCIYQDHNGYIWVGTLGGGACKFNGKIFENFTVSEGLSDNLIYSILEDNSNNIWIATFNGLTRYTPPQNLSDHSGNTRKGKFSTFFTKHGLLDNRVTNSLKDKEGNLWLSTLKGISVISKDHVNDSIPLITNLTVQEGLMNNYVPFSIDDNLGNIYMMNQGGFSIINASHLDKLKQTSNDTNIIKYLTLENGLSTDFIIDITKDIRGNVWFISTNEVSMLDPFASQGTGSYVITNYSLKGKFENISPNKIHVDNEYNIWIGTRENGLFKFITDKEKNEIIPLSTFTMNSGLPNNYIHSLLTDQEGNLWIGTDGGGISKFSGSRFEVYTVSDGLPHNIVYSTYEDKKGRYWFGTFGGGFCIFNPFAEKKYMNFNRTEKNFISNVVTIAMEDQYGYLLMGTSNGLVRLDPNVFPDKNHSYTVYDPSNGMPGRNIFAIFKDTQNNIWTGFSNGLVKLTFKHKLPGGNSIQEDFNYTYYTKENGLISNFIRSITEDNKGNIWVGTGEGISVLPLTQAQDTAHLFENYTTENGLPHNDALYVYSSKKGQLWVATQQGIALFNPINKKFQHFNKHHGLSSDVVSSIIEDKEGNLWLGTNVGIDKLVFDKEGNIQIKHYGKSEGFLGIETNQSAAYMDRKANIWFGSINGVIKYCPEEDRINTIEPLTHITKIQLFFENVELPSNAVYTYDQNYFTFHFIGISYTVSEKVKYQFKLEGFDNEWLPVTNETKATYANISPGQYTFLVKACNNDGIWNAHPSTYSFEITPPFWRTWWFFVLTSTGMILIALVYIKWRVRNLQRAKKVLGVQVRLRTHQLLEEKRKLEKANSDLNTAYHSLKKLEDFKETMMSMIVHDLKNPLNTIIGFSKHKPVKRTMNTIYQTGNHMLNMVLNILDIQKYEETKIKLETVIFPVSLVVHDAIRQVKFLVTEKRLNIHNKVNPQIHAKFDFEIISRVLVNLLNNAIKFTEAGGHITIDATLISERDVLNFACISVSDTGMGIPTDKINTLFEKYSQVETRKSGNARATGLGLVFCKLMAEAHGGKIWVESALGKGTTFYFTLQGFEKITTLIETMLDERSEAKLHVEEKNKIEFTLSVKDKNIIFPFFAVQTELDVYETSKNITLLKKVEVNGNKNIEAWITEMKNAVIDRDEIKYKELLNLIK